MSFPNRKGFFNRLDGWEDLGVFPSTRQTLDGVYGTTTSICPNCRGRVRIGREDGKVFHFCKLCSVKLNVHEL